MKPYRELSWPRFWPFLRIKDEMPGHRIYLPWLSFVRFRRRRFKKWYIRHGLRGDGFSVGIGFGWMWFRMKGFIPAPPRGASNYLVTIVAKRGLPDYVLQQEIFESRYWLRHPWRLVDFYWFFGYDGEVHEEWWRHTNYGKYRQAAAHLASVECQSRAQEIRAKYVLSGTEAQVHEEWMSQVWEVFADQYGECEARDYARSIHGATNYPFIKAAGWDEERVYNEIVRNL